MVFGINFIRSTPCRTNHPRMRQARHPRKSKRRTARQRSAPGPQTRRFAERIRENYLSRKRARSLEKCTYLFTEIGEASEVKIFSEPIARATACLIGARVRDFDKSSR